MSIAVALALGFLAGVGAVVLLLALVVGAISLLD